MTIFLCEPGYTGILSGIYDAGVSKIPQDELRLEIKNSGQNGGTEPERKTVDIHQLRLQSLDGIHHGWKRYWRQYVSD